MKELPMGFNGAKNTRAPAMSYSQSIGWKGETRIEYVIIKDEYGYSDESGETLNHVKVERAEQYCPHGNQFDIFSGSIDRKIINLYMNKEGDAYRSWKGKLNGKPVCNFYRGVVYDNPKRKNS